MIDDYEEPPDGWEPTPEQWALLKDAPNLDPDAHMGGEREAAEGRRWLEERERERAKVKRLELRLIVARADVLEHRLLKRIRRYRERMGVAVDEEDLRYWLNKRDRAHERIMLINRIALKAEKGLANVNR